MRDGSVFKANFYSSAGTAVPVGERGYPKGGKKANFSIENALVTNMNHNNEYEEATKMKKWVRNSNNND